MNSIPPYSSNPSERQFDEMGFTLSQFTGGDEDAVFFEDCAQFTGGDEDFWWDEEERHELF